MKRVLLTLLASCGLGSSAAFAAVPTEASAAVTELITDATAYIGSLWPLLVVVVVGFIFMKLFKKGINKST